VIRNNARSTLLKLLIEKSDNWDFCWSDHSDVETFNLIIFSVENWYYYRKVH
jgi:hypothetical protein